MYDGWSSEDLKWKIFRLENRIRELEADLRDAMEEVDHLRFRIKNELEPRIRNEKRAYDAWVSDPERRN